MQERLIRAISEWRIIGFFFGALAVIVEPRLLGRNRSGELLLGGWRVNGGGLVWKEYPVSQMSSLIERNGAYTGEDEIELGSIAGVICSGFVAKRGK